MNRENLKRLMLTKLAEASETAARQWQAPSGTATRHFVIDDFFPEDVANSIFSAFNEDESMFLGRKSFRERKRTFANLAESKPILRHATEAFQLPEVIEKVGELTKMEQLEADPSLYAGGLSMMFQGDFLNPHIDNSHDAKRTRYRRLNLLYYVTPNWALECGGNFELWDESVTKPITIVSKFNRLVVMETNASSWHSVSPVKNDIPRCCLSNYYFSKASPSGAEYYHVTSFTGRPDEPTKRLLSSLDNTLRNSVSRAIELGRGNKLKGRRSK